MEAVGNAVHQKAELDYTLAGLTGCRFRLACTRWLLNPRVAVGCLDHQEVEVEEESLRSAAVQL